MTLSRLQALIARTVSQLPEAQDFALAGGGALVVLGIVDRPTEDLDYFATAPEAVERLGPAVERALVEQGLTVEARRTLPGFARYRIADGAEDTWLDLAWDARLHPTQSTEFGPTLGTDELAADKTLALFGRAEARDFVDVYRLRTVYSRDQLLRLAHHKDRGFTADRFAEAVERVDRYERRDFPVDDALYESLRAEFDDWRRWLVGEHTPERNKRPRATDPELPGLDLGL